MEPACGLIKENSSTRRWNINGNKDHGRSLQKQKRFSVLIVDDVRESIIPLERVLRNLGCSVFFVGDAHEAIEFLTYDSEIQLIFLDWNMPQIEGGKTIELTEKLISEDKKSEEIWEGRSLPVVTYTGEDIEKMYVPITSHFAFIDHWPKSMAFQDLYLQVQGIINYLMKQNH